MTYIHYWDYKYLAKILGEKPKTKTKDKDDNRISNTTD